MEYYEVNIAGLTRRLPIVAISPSLSIASFVILGDAELVVAVAPELDSLIPEVDYYLTAEAKGIPLVHEMATLRKMPYYIVARKSTKSYMVDPLEVNVNSITTSQEQLLILDGHDADLLRGKRVAIIDDVISSGESLTAIETLAEQAGAIVVAKAAILAEGDAIGREDIIVLGELPLFPKAI